MNLQNYNDKILHSETLRASRTEKTATVNLLKHLQEVCRRKLYVDYGHTTLPKYVVAELGYSENEAWTRIQAMRLLKIVPHIEEKIESGQISLSNASTLQGFIHDNGIQKQPEKIADAVKKATELSNRKLKEEFNPQEPKEKKIFVNLKLQEKIKKLQQSWGEMSETEILEALIDEKLMQIELKVDNKKLSSLKPVDLKVDDNRQRSIKFVGLNVEDDKQRSIKPLEIKVERNKQVSLKQAELKVQNKQRPIKQVSTTQTRYIPISVKREIFERSNSQCEHKNKDGFRCNERRNLQYDHITPFALNGGRTADNIRMLCFAHNQRRGIQTFGKWR